MLKTYGQKIAYSTAVQVVGKIITTVLSLVLIAYLTRYLGVFGFGEYTTAFVYISFLGVIADFGFFNILVREIAAHPQDESKVANNLLTMRAFFALGIYLLGIIIVIFLPYSSTIKTGILILSSANFLLTQNSSIVGIFQAHHKMDRSVLTDVVGRIIILIISLWMIKNHLNLEMIFLANVAGNLINLLLSWLLVNSIVKLKLAFDFPLWKKIFVEAWPLGIAAIFGMIYFKIDSIMLSLFKGSQDVGIYGAPYKILEILTLVPGIFMGNVFPVIARYFNEDNEKLRPVIQKSFDFLAISAIGILGGGLVLAPNIIRFVAGSDFLSAYTVTLFGYHITAPIIFQILLFAVVASYFANLFGPIIIAINKQKSLIMPAVYASILNVILNVIFIPRFGYLAAALITVITEVFILMYWHKLTYKYFSYLPKFDNLLKIMLAGFVMIIGLFFLRNVNLILALLIGTVIYLTGLYLLKVITRDLILSLVSHKE